MSHCLFRFLDKRGIWYLFLSAYHISREILYVAS